MELLVGTRVLFQHVAGFKLYTILVGETHHHVHITCHTDLVEIPEWPAAEWGEACSKDQANVADDWVLNDFVLEALDGFVDEAARGKGSCR